MVELLHYILSNIIADPESIKIGKLEENDNVTLNVSLPQEERGIVIGKSGRNINAIRNIVSIIANREGKRVYIKILDE